MSETQSIRAGELKANDAVSYFDNICDKNGKKLTKSEKRARLKEMMTELYIKKEENICHLSDGRVVPIIVLRRNPGRGSFCYFNNIDAPKEEIFKAFASFYNITYKDECLEKKQNGALMASEVKHLFNNVVKNGKKLSGSAQREELQNLFKELYNHPEQNQLQTKDGIIPIIIKRDGGNYWSTYYLNAEKYHTEVMEAFANWAGCTYCQDKENLPPLRAKQKGEMTARECEKIFHAVHSLDKNITKKKTSSKLLDWFASVGEKEHLNTIELPGGEKISLLVQRQSHSQRCWCLNTADEYAKPFVIKRMAEIMQAEICLENLPISNANAPLLYKTMMRLETIAEKSKDEQYYKAYAQKIYEKLNMSKEITLSDMLINKAKAQSK